MTSTQVIPWFVLGSALYLASVLTDNPTCKVNYCTDRCPTVPSCGPTVATTTMFPHGMDWPKKPGFRKSRDESLRHPLMSDQRSPGSLHVRTPVPDCCTILSAQFQWNKTDEEVFYDNEEDKEQSLRNITVIRLSEDRIASRCRLYEQVVPGCKKLCPLYDMMCKNTREFVEGVQCFKNFLETPTSVQCSPHISLVPTSTDTEIAGSICALRLSYMNCVERNISAACGWMGVKVGMMYYFGGIGKTDYPIHDVGMNKLKLFAPVERLALLDSRCAEFVSQLAQHQSSPSCCINLGLLLSVALVMALLAFKPHQTRFGHSSWMLFIVILCLSAENVLSEDDSSTACAPCQEECPDPKASCPKGESTASLKLKIDGQCCHLFKKIVNQAAVYLPDDTHFTGPMLVPSMEKIANHCRLFEKNMPDCKEKCAASSLICNSPKAFFEGSECVKSLIWSVKKNIPKRYTDEGYYMICEKEFNATYAVRENATATYGSLCEAKLNYFKCIEQNFTKECGQAGRYLGIRHFFPHDQEERNYRVLSMEKSMSAPPNTRDPKCLEYVNYIGTHLDVSYSSSVRNTAMGFVFAFAIAVTKHGMARHLVELR